MKNVFFIVGPTATGKSELAAIVARKLDAEIVSADAFQIYRGLDLLTAKPDSATLAKVPHHLIGTISVLDEMSAEKFRKLALQAISEIHSRGKLAVVVGGSGLYIKALTHGLSVVPSADSDLRVQMNELSLADLQEKLRGLDPQTAVDLKNRRRVVRAIEICLLSGRAASEQRTAWTAGAPLTEADSRVDSKNCGGASHSEETEGVFACRDRDDLYQSINRRVEAMFDAGVVEEVNAAGAMGETASKMIGLREIRALLDGKMSMSQCVAAIQQATRRYAKRQLTWFRRQTNFERLNLSLLSTNEAVKWISQKARPAFAQGND
ncbi:MAG TPA: tRNA (adenosine(37)-N6)-dimethylallyltransferase MiaA [Chthoniobacterales bacterium]|jgi:tRNA dimethylallyltransferase|nr:tRNA (adenosine(37)-N6)-dimethylallyltransferase MiaA [Chthoniobacterales bacterium]